MSPAARLSPLGCSYTRTTGGEDVAPRGGSRGRDVLVEAAASLLATPTLDDLLAGLVTTRRVAALADVSPGTVSHHYPREDEDGDRLSLGRAGAERALTLTGGADPAAYEDRVLEVLDRLQAGDADVAARLVQAIRETLPVGLRADEGGLEGRLRTVSRFLHAAVAPGDERARRSLAEVSGAVRDVHADAYRALVRELDREFVADTTAEDVASLVLALADGITLQGCHDRRTDPGDRYVLGVLALFDSLTRPVDEAATLDGLESLLPLPTGTPLGPRQRRRIRDATRRVYDDGGWERVTIERVARYAGVPRISLVDHYGSRHGLACLAWSRGLPEVERAVDRSRGRPPAARMRACLEAIARVATHDRELTSAFLHGVFAYTAAHGPPQPDDPFDPRSVVPLPAVVEQVVRADLTVYRPPWSVGDAGPRDAAAMLNNNLLLLAVTRPTLGPQQVADRTLQTTYRGMLREPGDPGEASPR